MTFLKIYFKFLKFSIDSKIELFTGCYGSQSLEMKVRRNFQTEFIKIKCGKYACFYDNIELFLIYIY